MSMIAGSKKLPLRHLTIRVPWNDSGFNGKVCNTPKCNTSCLILKRIGQEKNQDSEEKIKGMRIGDLKESQRPPCQHERVSFMDPEGWTRTVSHAYAESSESHKHYQPTPYQHDGYSAACNPYYWMMSENAEELAKDLDLEFNPNREPELSFKTIWVQERTNQLILLDTFFSALREEESLCFFYSKRTPLSESNKRVIVGIGKVKRVGQSTEYKYSVSNPELRSSLWERNVCHSIRPDFSDGFLFPYNEVLELSRKDPSINPEDYVAFAPDEEFENYSYATEHLETNGAIASLLSAEKAILKIEKILQGPWKKVLTWIDGELNRLWKLRGAYPGIGSALTAFGISNGTLVALEIEKIILNRGNFLDHNPWAVFHEIMEDPSIVDGKLSKQVKKRWESLSENEKELLMLLSRFALSPEQTARFYIDGERNENLKVEDILRNPYLLYEKDRYKEDSISLQQIDMGMFPDKVVSEKYPFPERSKMSDELDERRVRALVIHQLEQLASQGHTVYFKKFIIENIRSMELIRPCPLGPGAINLAEKIFGEDVQILGPSDEDKYYQLSLYRECRQLIRETVTGRKDGKRHASNLNWRTLLDSTLPPIDAKDKDELLAREEKSLALQELYESRVSVLVGPAGTGKTTLLKILCRTLKEQGETFLLLAPTGKARVRLSSQTGVSGAQTLAQFLSAYNRYDGDTGRYLVNFDKKKPKGYNNVIIDECSMLTEEQLASVFDSLNGVGINRIIMVGDPRQLPPIGAGRPFLDIINFLIKGVNVREKFPRISKAYSELTIVRRQEGDNREDVLLSQFFSGEKPSPASESAVTSATKIKSDFLRLVQWDTEEDLESKLIDVLVEELKLNGPDDDMGFEQSVGGSLFGNAVYFSNKYGDNPGSGSFAENWQILSPIKPGGAGIELINRLLQDRFRKKVWEWINTEQRYWRKVPNAAGPQRILYGDKVINVQNSFKTDIWPEPDNKDEKYIANGDIGIVVGQYKGKNSNIKGLPWKLEVEFSSKLGHKVGYAEKQFGDDSANPLELAYGLTVHKAQGSQFGVTIVVLPNPCWLLSRELLYTALTRQEHRIVILHQGDWEGFLKYSADEHSSMTTRFTNLFSEARPIKISTEQGDKYFEENLIHKTLRGDLVRSKSEVIVANLLYENGLREYIYEAKCVSVDGQGYKLPDFTIIDNNSGKVVLWEHLGMLEVSKYKKSWNEKEKWYQKNGIQFIESGGGDNGALVITKEHEDGSIDCEEIMEQIKKAKKYLGKE